MKPSFSVTVLDFEVLQAMEGAWRPDDFAMMLQDMDYGDTGGMSADEIREMCMLCLQDLDPTDAATIVLTRRFGDNLTGGQIQNVASEMQDEKMWEEYPNMAVHEQMFAVGSLLYEAAPSHFPEPDAVRVILEVQPMNKLASSILAEPLSEAFVVRLVAGGMDDGVTLKRLFDEQLKGDEFNEADTIVWTVDSEIQSDSSVRISLVSSGYWLDALRDTQSYDSTAHDDGED
jgi:hypothetical protein